MLLCSCFSCQYTIGTLYEITITNIWGLGKLKWLNKLEVSVTHMELRYHKFTTNKKKANLQLTNWRAHLQLFVSFSDSFPIFFLPPTMTIFTKISKCFSIKQEHRPSWKQQAYRTQNETQCPNFSSKKNDHLSQIKQHEIKREPAGLAGGSAVNLNFW